MALAVPVIICETAGVPNFGCTRANSFGTRWSRPRVTMTLAPPISDTSRLVVMPVTAPTLTSMLSQVTPRSLNAVPKGALGSMVSQGTMPTRVNAISMYRTVQVPKETRMPMGRSRPGRLTSSAVLATVSNPMKEKKTMDAAPEMAGHPLGTNGV
eukprot:scaffold46616_cov44-Prasinocladus_malaysianus.AAC.2